MAKGRRLTTSRSERYLGIHPNNTYTTNEPDELREEDVVWSMLEEGDGRAYDETESAWEPRAAASTPIPRRIGGLTLAFEEPATPLRIVHQTRDPPLQRRPSSLQRRVASSAPMNVPDWKKILRVNSVESINDDSDEAGSPDTRVDPPHEYLARSRQKDGPSVFEGVGRTLKGRDMRRLRDTVWSQTGFDG